MPPTDDELMEIALGEAAAAAAAGAVPVGAVVALGENVVAVGRNRREIDRDPTAHAEIVALRAAAARVGTWRLDGATLCVTLEPCPMCAGALVNARASRLVYGCDDPKAGAARTLYALCDDVRLNHRMAVRGGVAADRAATLLRAFFAARR